MLNQQILDYFRVDDAEMNSIGSQLLLNTETDIPSYTKHFYEHYKDFSNSSWNRFFDGLNGSGRWKVEFSDNVNSDTDTDFVFERDIILTPLTDAERNNP